MAYISQTQDPRRRAAALAGVAVVHTALALALLSIGVVGDKVNEPPWKPFVLTPDPVPTPPPTPETIPEPTDTVITAPVTPFDPLRPADDSVLVDEPIFDDRPWADDTPVVPPTPTPRPSPSFTPKDAFPANRQAGWITTDDYPARELRGGVEGVASYRVLVGSSGQVSSCEVTRSTGNRALDDATCRLISRRARFEAATDENGASVVSSYSGKVRWDIPG